MSPFIAVPDDDGVADPSIKVGTHLVDRVRDIVDTGESPVRIARTSTGIVDERPVRIMLEALPSIDAVDASPYGASEP